MRTFAEEKRGAVLRQSRDWRESGSREPQPRPERRRRAGVPPRVRNRRRGSACSLGILGPQPGWLRAAGRQWLRGFYTGIHTYSSYHFLNQRFKLALKPLKADKPQR